MWVEVWWEDKKHLLNTDHIRRITPVGEDDVEVCFDGSDWDIDEYGAPERRMSMVIYDVSYDEFRLALQLPQPFISLVREREIA